MPKKNMLTQSNDYVNINKLSDDSGCDENEGASRKNITKCSLKTKQCKDE